MNTNRISQLVLSAASLGSGLMDYAKDFLPPTRSYGRVLRFVPNVRGERAPRVGNSLTRQRRDRSTIKLRNPNARGNRRWLTPSVT